MIKKHNKFKNIKFPVVNSGKISNNLNENKFEENEKSTNILLVKSASNLSKNINVKLEKMKDNSSSINLNNELKD